MIIINQYDQTNQRIECDSVDQNEWFHGSNGIILIICDAIDDAMIITVVLMILWSTDITDQIRG